MRAELTEFGVSDGAHAPSMRATAAPKLLLTTAANVANLPPKPLILLAGAPRAGARHLRSRAANGKTPGRHDDRSATLSLDWDRSPSGNAWRMPRPRKRVLELSGGVGSRPQVPRWNAVRRARRVRREPRPYGADHRKTCAWRRSASFLFVVVCSPG